MSERLELVPLGLSDANEMVRQFHRHNQPVPGCKFCIGVQQGDKLVGAIIVGRPVARWYDNGHTLEVTRCATDGTRNAPSMLYAAAQRATFALGYRRLITYTRTDESGATMRGIGWKVIAERPARSWAKASIARPREDQSEPHARLLWEASLGSVPAPTEEKR